MEKRKILSLLFVLFLSGGIFYSCQDNNEELLNDVIVKSDFQLSNADHHLQNLVLHINKSSGKTKGGNYDFEAEIRSRFGTAMWTEPISFWGNEKLNFVIPIKSLDEEKEIESILFFVMDSLSTDYFVYTREKALQFIKESGYAASGLWMFDYFTQHALGRQPKDGASLSKVPVNNVKAYYQTVCTWVDKGYVIDGEVVVIGSQFCWTQIFDDTQSDLIGDGGGSSGSVDLGYGGGGSSGGGNLGNMAPQAKTIFKNTQISDTDWKKLQKLLDPILDKCLGKFLSADLAKLLENQKINIRFDYIGTSSSFNAATNTLTLHAAEGSDVLLHELMHIYQRFKNLNFSSYYLNDEIEARYIQYLYLSSQKSYIGSEWEANYNGENKADLAIRRLEDYIDSKGSFLAGSNEELLELHFLNRLEPIFDRIKAYSSLNLDPAKRYIDSFNNLNMLTIKC